MATTSRLQRPLVPCKTCSNHALRRSACAITSNETLIGGGWPHGPLSPSSSMDSKFSCPNSGRQKRTRRLGLTESTHQSFVSLGKRPRIQLLNNSLWAQVVG